MTPLGSGWGMRGEAFCDARPVPSRERGESASQGPKRVKSKDAAKAFPLRPTRNGPRPRTDSRRGLNDGRRGAETQEYEEDSTC